MATTVLLVIGALFLLVGAGIVVVDRDPSRRDLAAELWGLYRLQLVVVGFVLVPAWLGSGAFMLAMAGLAVVTQRELLAVLVPEASPGWRRASGLAAAGALPVAWWLGPTPAWAAPVALVAGALAMDIFTAPHPPRLGRAARGVLTVVFPPMFLAYLVWVHDHPEGFQRVAFLYGAVETCDAFALLLGKAKGSRLAFPSLSPGKTVVGVVGGLTAGACAGMVLGMVGTSLSPGRVALATAVALGGAILGDLAASKIKRNLGRKDFGAAVPGHGGVLDVYDTLAFVAPAVYAAMGC